MPIRWLLRHRHAVQVFFFFFPFLVYLLYQILLSDDQCLVFHSVNQSQTKLVGGLHAYLLSFPITLLIHGAITEFLFGWYLNILVYLECEIRNSDF